MTWLTTVERTDQAAEARRDFVQHLSARAEPGSDIEAAELIFTELLSNALRFGAVRVTLEWLPEGRLRVHDRGAPFDGDVPVPDLTSERGRGLYLVKQLAKAISYERDGEGNVAIALLPVRLRGALS